MDFYSIKTIAFRIINSFCYFTVQMKNLFYTIILFILTLSQHIQAKTWTDSMDIYAREKFMPPAKYQWKWQKAALLSVMVKQYDKGDSSTQKIYFDFIKKSMDKTYFMANGKIPNAVASGLGMAFLARVTKDEKYINACQKIFKDYLKMKRTAEGGVSHLPKNIELWDDTVFMIGEFLIELYRATGDEKYIDELYKQISIHRNKLQDKTSGLWYHGWDNDNKSHCTFCGQPNCFDKTTRTSTEIWGRGNGWIVVTLSDVLQVLPKTNTHWNDFAQYLKEMVQHLPEWQNKENGHWYQLPLKYTDPKNFIESSSTAMFAYGENVALNLGIIEGEQYKTSVELAYQGLRNYSIKPLSNNYLTTKNVCKGTCIGDKNYYLKRKVVNGKAFAIGMFINFGFYYEMHH